MRPATRMTRLFLIVGPTVVWTSIAVAAWWSKECAYHCAPIQIIVLGLAPLGLALALAAVAGVYAVWILIKYRQVVVAAAIVLLVCGPVVLIMKAGSILSASRAGRRELWTETRLRRLAAACAAAYNASAAPAAHGRKNAAAEFANPAHWRSLPMIHRFGAEEMLITKNAVQLNCRSGDCYTLFRHETSQTWRLSWARGRFKRGPVIWRQFNKLLRPAQNKIPDP